MFATFSALCSVCMFSVAWQRWHIFCRLTMFLCFMRFMKFTWFLALSNVLLFPGWGVDGGSGVLGVGFGIFLQKWQGVRILSIVKKHSQKWQSLAQGGTRDKPKNVMHRRLPSLCTRIIVWPDPKHLLQFIMWPAQLEAWMIPASFRGWDDPAVNVASSFCTF